MYLTENLRYLLTLLLDTLEMRAIFMTGRHNGAPKSKVFQNSPAILSHLLNLFISEGYCEILSDGTKNDFVQVGFRETKVDLIVQKLVTVSTSLSPLDTAHGLSKRLFALLRYSIDDFLCLWELVSGNTNRDLS